MDIESLLNDKLTENQKALKKAFEIIISLTSTELKLSSNDPLSPIVEQLQQTECFLKHQLEFANKKIHSLEAKIKEFDRKAALVETYKRDFEFESSQNLKLVGVIAKTHEERRLIEAKNEHLRTEFGTKINLLNQSIKDHRDNFNNLEREKKKQDAEIKSLREENFTCKLALGKYEGVGNKTN